MRAVGSGGVLALPYGDSSRSGGFGRPAVISHRSIQIDPSAAPWRRGRISRRRAPPPEPFDLARLTQADFDENFVVSRRRDHRCLRIRCLLRQLYSPPRCRRRRPKRAPDGILSPHRRQFSVTILRVEPFIRWGTGPGLNQSNGVATTTTRMYKYMVDEVRISFIARLVIYITSSNLDGK